MRVWLGRGVQGCVGEGVVGERCAGVCWWKQKLTLGRKFNPHTGCQKDRNGAMFM